MSTKSSIYCEDDIHIYEDCSEPALSFGKWIGDFVYLEGDLGGPTIRAVRFENTYLLLLLKKDSLLTQTVGSDTLKIHGCNVEYVEVENDSVLIKLHPYSTFVKAFKEKKYTTVIVETLNISPGALPAHPE